VGRVASTVMTRHYWEKINYGGGGGGHFWALEEADDKLLKPACTRCLLRPWRRPLRWPLTTVDKHPC